MGFFTSEREDQAKSNFGQENADWSKLLDSINQMQSSYQGINSLQGSNSKFGLPSDVNASFNPARANLATRNAQARSGAAARMSGSNAMPEMTYGGIDASFAPAYGDLENNAAQAGIQNQRYNANFLSDIFGKQDAFGANKAGMQLQGTSGKTKMLNDYLQNLSGTSPFDDVLAVAGTGAKMYGATQSPVNNYYGKG